MKAALSKSNSATLLVMDSEFAFVHFQGTTLMHNVHISNPQVHSVGEMQSCNVYSSCSYFFLLIMLPKGQGRKQGSLMCIEAITVV